MNSGSIIDHVITNKNILCKMNLMGHYMSDHKVMNISVEENIRINIKTVEKRRRLNLDEWRKNVQNAMNVKDVKNFDELVDLLTSQKEASMEEYNIKILNNDKWFNNEIRIQIKIRGKLYKRWKLIGSEELKEEFMKSKKKVNNLRRKFKQQWLQNKFEKAKYNSLKTWKIINSLIGTNNGNLARKMEVIKNEYGIEIRKEYNMAQEFNKYFAGIGPKIVATMMCSLRGLIIKLCSSVHAQR